MFAMSAYSPPGSFLVREGSAAVRAEIEVNEYSGHQQGRDGAKAQLRWFSFVAYMPNLILNIPAREVEAGDGMPALRGRERGWF
jgi:hypothetical protein